MNVFPPSSGALFATMNLMNIFVRRRTQRMQTTASDFVIGSLLAWRMRGGDGSAMEGVIAELNALAFTNGTSMYLEAIKPGAYPVLTAKGNPCLTLWPYEADADFGAALEIMERHTGFTQPGGAVVSIVVGALCAWREDRSGGCNGMQAVLNVLWNRATLRRSSMYAEATRPLQFSAMTAPSDPELNLWPSPGDELFSDALELAVKAQAGALEDITNGAVSYYAKSMAVPPYWAATMIRTASIGGQIYFKLARAGGVKEA